MFQARCCLTPINPVPEYQLIIPQNGLFGKRKYVERPRGPSWGRNVLGLLVEEETKRQTAFVLIGMNIQGWPMAPPPVQKKSEPFVLFFRVLRHQPSIDAFDQSRGIVSYKTMDGQHNWTFRDAPIYQSYSLFHRLLYFNNQRTK